MPDRTSLPVVPLRDTVLFPGVATPITAGRTKTLRAVEAALSAGKDGRYVFAVAQRDGAEEPTADGLYAVGVIARVEGAQRFGAGLQLVLACESRATALRYGEHDGVIRATTARLDDLAGGPLAAAAIAPLAREVREQALAYGRRRGAPEDLLQQFIGSATDPIALVHHVAFYMDLGTAEKQALLETLSAEQRLRLLAAHLDRQIRAADAQAKARSCDERSRDDRPREVIVGDTRKATAREPEGDDEPTSIHRLEQKIGEIGLPDEVIGEVRRDLARLKRMGRETSPEAQVLTTWLEWIAELPWRRRTLDHVDLDAARRVLEEDHHGLGDIKDRVLELLAVRKLRAEQPRQGERASQGPILLFLGPPGTGKTSIAESIARAIGRRYARVSLGGARDEADIRGHRRTYVGAMPGRILSGIRRAGTKNPVFVLDEIDKMGASFQGDPAAALLEVLDPAQNAGFVDHYLGVPFDLSEVLFICTANLREGIPTPLFDRMEAIAFSGYTEAEKLAIARRYLLPRQRAESGLGEDDLALSDAALLAAIGGYTREAGVRQLERAIGSIARKAARRIVDGELARARITVEADVRALLGRPRVRTERALEGGEPGVATGMYYTQAGGDIMHVEASVMPGRGELVMTGQLGEVMKESGRAALTWARTHAPSLGVPERALHDHDYHLHVPAGAVPKDGPSAGVTMAVALVSALSSRPARADLAMTGEITLRGRILPIGGVKEKVLGAERAGIAEIVLPRDNEADLEELAEDVRQRLSFHLVASLDEAMEIALGPPPARAA